MARQVTLSKDYHLPILLTLYQHKDIAAYQVLDNALLNKVSAKEKIEKLNQLKEFGLVVFEKELKYEEPVMGTYDPNSGTVSMADNPLNNEPIKAKITDKGIIAVDKQNAI